MKRSPLFAVLMALATAGTTMYAVYRLLVRSYVTNWGATAEEAERRMPGDEVVPNPRVLMTHAVTVEAPAAAVWPWLVQIGSGRAGWYSYDSLDNSGVESARQILPEYQGLKVGDRVPMTADGKMAMPVTLLEPGRYLVLGGAMDTKSGQPVDLNDPLLDDYFAGTWGFVLDEVGANTTRLIVRCRLDWSGSAAMAPMYLLEPGSFVMNRKMLLGIKERVEASQRATAGA